MLKALCLLTLAAGVEGIKIKYHCCQSTYCSVCLDNCFFYFSYYMNRLFVYELWLSGMKVKKRAGLYPVR